MLELHEEFVDDCWPFSGSTIHLNMTIRFKGVKLANWLKVTESVMLCRIHRGYRCFEVP